MAQPESTWLKEVKTEAFEAFRISVPWEALLHAVISFDPLVAFEPNETYQLVGIICKISDLMNQHLSFQEEISLFVKEIGVSENFSPWLRPTSWRTLIKHLHGRSWGGRGTETSILTYCWHVSRIFMSLRNAPKSMQISKHWDRMEKIHYIPGGWSDLQGDELGWCVTHFRKKSCQNGDLHEWYSSCWLTNQSPTSDQEFLAARSGCGPCLAKIYHSRSLEEGQFLGKKKVARGL